MLSKEFFLKLCAVLAGVLFASVALAANPSSGGSSASIASIATNIGTAVNSISHVLSDVSTITGVGFIIASFFKLHQHKLNPTQVPMSQGITLLLIGAGLSVFPHLLNVVTSGVFGMTAVKIGAGITAIGS